MNSLGKNKINNSGHELMMKHDLKCTNSVKLFEFISQPGSLVGLRHKEHVLDLLVHILKQNFLNKISIINNYTWQRNANPQSVLQATYLPGPKDK